MEIPSEKGDIALWKRGTLFAERSFFIFA